MSLRQDLAVWIGECMKQLKGLPLSREEEMLANSFLTQYLLQSIKLTDIASRRSWKERLQRWSSRYLDKEILIQLSRSSLKNKEMVFWPFQPSHLSVQLPICQQLEKSDFPYTIFSNNASVVNGFPGYVNQELNFTVKSTTRWKSSKENEVTRLMDYFRQLPPFESETASVRFDQVFFEAWFSWGELYRTTNSIFQQIVDQAKPRSFFIGNDVTLVGRLVAQLAQEIGIRTYSVMHGNYDADFGHLVIVDKFFVFGDRDRQNLIRKGLDPSQVLVSGSPKLDQILGSRKSLSHPAIERIIGNKELALVTLSGPGHTVGLNHHLKIIELLISTAHQFPELQFIHKFHRKDRLRFYHPLLKKYRPTNVLLIEYGNEEFPTDIYPWIKACKFLITAASASALDAMVLGKPVVAIDLNGDLKNFEPNQAGATFYCADESDYRTSILDITGPTPSKDPMGKSAKYIKEKFANFEQDASEVIANFLIDDNPR